MPLVRHYSCPDCGGTFRWMHHPVSEPPPNYCPLCGSCVNPDPAFVPAAPHVAKTIGRTADGVYRQMEQAGRDHMEAAAELGGGDAADYAGLNVTDMPDYLKPGDMAAKINQNAVSQAMQNSGQGGFKPINGMSGADYAATTATGAFPRRGEAMRQEITSSHQARADFMKAIGTRERR